MKPFSIIVALDSARGIGRNNQLPWHLSGDLKHFKKLTRTSKDPEKQNVVIMGRKTWDSIPQKFRPLPNRINLVLTRNQNFKGPDGVLFSDSLDHALQVLDSPPLKEEVGDIFVIGGAQVYKMR